MKFIKSTIAAAVVAASVFFAPGAEAAPSTCWINGAPGSSLKPVSCDVTRRINYNGHTVWDINDYKGTKFTVVLWDNGTAEIVYPNGTVRYWNYWQDAEGDAYLEWEGHAFAFRFT